MKQGITIRPTSPALFPDLEFWFDGKDEDSLVLEYGSVVAWHDKAGNKEVLGAELVVDGSFDTVCGVNWKCGAGWTTGDGTDTAVLATSDLSQDILTDGKLYKITWLPTVTTAGRVTIKCGTAEGPGAAVGVPAMEPFIEYITCAGNTNFIISGAAFSGVISSISCKEVTTAGRTVRNTSPDSDTRPSYSSTTGRVTFVDARSTFLQSAAFAAAFAQPLTVDRKSVV